MYEKGYVGGSSIGCDKTAAPPSHRDLNTMAGALVKRLEELDSALTDIYARQNGFVHRVLPAEPRQEKQCDDAAASYGGNLIHDIDAMFGRISERVGEIAYLTGRMEKIA